MAVKVRLSFQGGWSECRPRWFRGLPFAAQGDQLCRRIDAGLGARLFAALCVGERLVELGAGFLLSRLATAGDHGRFAAIAGV